MLTEDVHTSLPISQGCLSQLMRTGGRKTTLLPWDEQEMPSLSLLSQSEQSSRDGHGLQSVFSLRGRILLRPHFLHPHL